MGPCSARNAAMAAASRSFTPGSSSRSFTLTRLIRILLGDCFVEVGGRVDFLRAMASPPRAPIGFDGAGAPVRAFLGATRVPGGGARVFAHESGAQRERGLRRYVGTGRNYSVTTTGVAGCATQSVQSLPTARAERAVTRSWTVRIPSTSSFRIALMGIMETVASRGS